MLLGETFGNRGNSVVVLLDTTDLKRCARLSVKVSQLSTFDDPHCALEYSSSG